MVGEDGLLVGVLSVKDIGRYVAEAFEDAGALEQADMLAILNTPVSRIASKPPIVLHEDSLCRAVEIMITRNIGFVPRVDSDGRILYAYTELDTGFELLDLDKPARDYASTSVVTGEPEEPVIEALGFMLEQGFRRIPFRLGSEYYIATMSSLLRAIVKRPRAETLLEPVKTYAMPAAVLDYNDASIGDVAEIILAVTERAVLLLDNGELSAIITERDLVRAYADNKECNTIENTDEASDQDYT